MLPATLVLRRTRDAATRALYSQLVSRFVSRQGLAVDSVSRYFALITCIPSNSAGQKPERATGIEPA